MKIITKPAEKEESKIFCDVCKTNEAVAWMQFLGGYGSSFDMVRYNLDLCSVHANELLDMLQYKYKNNLQEKELDNLLEDPWK